MSKEIQVINKNTQVAPVSSADAMLSIIERAASNPQMDIVKMQALMDMRSQEIARADKQQQEELARIAKKEFNADYVVMSNKLPVVIKNRFNNHTTSKYASHDDISKVIKPILADHGFGLTCDVIAQSKESLTVEAILIHRGGHEKSIKIIFPIDNVGMKGEKNKTDIQGIASSLTYAKRVTICTLLDISTGDDKDGNSAENEPSYITPAETADIEKQIAELKIDKVEFLKYMGVESLDKIEFRFKAKALASLNKKRKTLSEAAGANT